MTSERTSLVASENGLRRLNEKVERRRSTSQLNSDERSFLEWSWVSESLTSS